MPTTIKWSLNLQVSEGPKLSASPSLDVEAYDKIVVEINKSESKRVEVQPGGAGQVKLLLIKSSKYDSNISYKVNGNNPSIKLDQLQFLVGDGAISLLQFAPESLDFTNGTDEPINIEILIGRDATPEVV